MSTIDWVIVAVYAMIMFGIGFAANRRQNGTEEYFLGARQLPWWALGISLIATAFSSAALLGNPAEGYQYGFLQLQLQLGDLIGMSLVILLFLPFFIKLNLTTAYEYLERRFDAKTRSLGSFFFILFVVSRLGALLYGASLVLTTVIDLPLPVAILLVGIVSIIYTIAGGMAAVVWTDVLQFLMILIGLGAGIWAISSGTTGGFGALWQVANEGGKITAINLAWEPENFRALPTAIIAYGTLAFAIAGTNQQSVQRYVACADVKSGRKAILLGWFAGFIGVAATLLIGVLLFGFYELNVATLPSDIKPDGILPYFIRTQMPAGAAGLLITAIFAAAMSSIDSALHSLATCITVDFYQRYTKVKRSEESSLWFAQGLIVFWGIFGILSAFYAASTEENLIAYLIKYTSIFLGPLLGLFLMGILLPRINATGAFYGTIVAGLLLELGSTLKLFSFPLAMWQAVAAVPLAIVLGLLISLLGKIPPKRSTTGLTLWS